jgi:hypothetical protein
VKKGYSPIIDTTSVDQATAAAIEAAEARAWADSYAAAPADFAEAVGLDSTEIGGTLVLRWAESGRRYFSRTVGLGVGEPATAKQVDRVLDCFAEAGITMFLLQSLPHCTPAEYETWLHDRGLEPFDVQDRVFRDGRPLGTIPQTAREITVERITSGSAEEWSGFLQRVYRLDTGPWLPLLIDRKGWHQYVAHEDGKLVAARGMYIGVDGMAWLGMDCPVPGVMTEDYAPDAAICAYMIEDGLANGARAFLADIEVPSYKMDTPAYQYFSQLGFSRPYVRTHYARL